MESIILNKFKQKNKKEEIEKMSKTQEYEFHEYAKIFPLLEGEEKEELREDLKKNGLLESITLYEDKILDGQNRYVLCKEEGIEPIFKELPEGKDPLDYVVSINLKRRHLYPAQKSKIALVLLPYYEERARIRFQEFTKTRPKNEDGTFLPINPNSDEMNNKSQSLDDVGKMVGIGRNIISQTKKIKKIVEGYTDKDGIKHDPEPLVAQEWNKALKGEQGVDAVYQKAKIIENVNLLPKTKAKSMKEQLANNTLTFEQAKKELLQIKEKARKEKLSEEEREAEALKTREESKRKGDLERLITLNGDLKKAQENLEDNITKANKIIEEVRTRYEIQVSDIAYAYTDLLERSEKIIEPKFAQINEALESAKESYGQLEYGYKLVQSGKLDRCPFCLNKPNLEDMLTQLVLYEQEVKDFEEGKASINEEKAWLDDKINLSKKGMEKILSLEELIDELETEIKENQRNNLSI